MSILKQNYLANKLLPYIAVILIVASCATTPKVVTPPPKPVDIKAQQQYYDLGLQSYSNENYVEAKRAFQLVVELGPNTELGMKARENLKKIQQILNTLKEIELK